MPRPWSWLSQPTRDDGVTLVNTKGLIPDGCNPRDRPVSREKSFQVRPWKRKVNNDAQKTNNAGKADVDRGYHQLFSEQGPTSFFDFGRNRTEEKIATPICQPSLTAPTVADASASSGRAPPLMLAEPSCALPPVAALDHAPCAPSGAGASVCPPLTPQNACRQVTTAHTLLNAKCTTTQVSTIPTSTQSLTRVLINQQGEQALVHADTARHAFGPRQPDSAPPAVQRDPTHLRVASAIKNELGKNRKECGSGVTSMSRVSGTTKCGSSDIVAEPAVVTSFATAVGSYDSLPAGPLKSVDALPRVPVSLPRTRHTEYPEQRVGTAHAPAGGAADIEASVPQLHGPPAKPQTDAAQLAANANTHCSQFYSGWKLRQAQLYANRTSALPPGRRPNAEIDPLAVDDVSAVDVAKLKPAGVGETSLESQAQCTTSFPSAVKTVAHHNEAACSGGKNGHNAGRAGESSPSKLPTRTPPSELSTWAPTSEQGHDNHEPGFGLGKGTPGERPVQDGEQNVTENDEDQVRPNAEQRKPNGLMGQGELAPTDARALAGALLCNVPSTPECAKNIEIKQEKTHAAEAVHEAESTTTKPDDCDAVPPTVGRPAWQHVGDTKTTCSAVINSKECGAAHSATTLTDVSSTPHKTVCVTPDNVRPPTRIHLPVSRPVTAPNQPTPSAPSSATSSATKRPPPTMVGCSPVSPRQHAANVEHTPRSRPCAVMPNVTPPRIQKAPPRPTTARDHLPQFTATHRARVDQTPPAARPTTSVDARRTPPPMPPAAFAVSNRIPFLTRPTTVGAANRPPALACPTTTGATTRLHTRVLPTTTGVTDPVSRTPLSARAGEDANMAVAPRMPLSSRGHAPCLAWGDGGRQIKTKQDMELWRNIAEEHLDCRPKTAPYQVFDSQKAKPSVEKSNQPASRNYIPKTKNNHAVICR